MSPLQAPSSAAAAGSKHRTLMAGAWGLAQGRALGLHAGQPAELRILRGRVWVTLGDALHRSEPVGMQVAGDVFLHAGDVLRVPRGARLVMESLDTASEPAALFDWVEDSGRALRNRPGRFRREVLAPGHDLALALRQAALAFTRLVRGLLGYGEFLVAGRGRVLSRFEGNPP
ncbi:DUF2917 domain-containing protein [Hydrogenophaga sp.]|uniref:DUF2917 domain-containing protein n=1 Tax=Hydrogenophaga sp. TaxID=1904254 RepID=UPI002722329D|nr:DUF2917 domain-containing protein [Hydrogenophaga sp.]MDO8904471.1 DUF2917 domain-containing protein [Hydrogenophaga sp.]